MMHETGLRRLLPDQLSGSGHTFGTTRHPSINDPILSKRVCFYKSGDPQFSGLRLVINSRTFKTFDALLDSLSKKVPLPFGVRNITTPRGVHAICTLDELEDGKSYICSDSRRVKPINLALARKKLPPWYNARPVTSHRRRTVRQAAFFPGWSIHKQKPVVVRTPKKLLVFRNGDPTVRHTVVLHKKTTPSYESILEYISELMQFHVVKLYTPEGRRVDGLPGLILCSGTVVAVGREPFRPATYSAETSPAPKWLHTNRMGLKRQKDMNRKKKSLSFSSKSRNFSPSSERFIVNQIHNTIAGSLCDVPCDLSNSAELESRRILESVAETEGGAGFCDGDERRSTTLPNEDDIEKSFRVNQDGSMTVEMKVRLTLKEEETIHWTTTLTRSSVANQLNATCLPELEAGQEICSPESNSLDLQSPAASIDFNKDKTRDDNDDDPPSLGNGAFSESGNEEDDIKNHSDVLSPRRAPTPGHKQLTNNEQSSTKPVPKPRRFESTESSSRNISSFKSAEMTEFLQIESSGEEIAETVVHIYEQQTCQDNFLANVCAHSMSASGITFGRPATSETGHLSSNNEFDTEHWRPSTASESISIWRTESMSLTSDLNLPPMKTGALQTTTRKFQAKPQQINLSKHGMVSSKPKAVKHLGKKQEVISGGATKTPKKAKTFSSAGFLKRIYGNKSKSTKSIKKLKKRPTQNGDGGVTKHRLEQSDDTTHSMVKNPNIPSALTEHMSERVSFETSRMSVSPSGFSQPRGILTRQTSMHTEKKGKHESYVTNKYIENWLEQAHFNPKTENSRCGDSENKQEVKCWEETSKIETCQASEPPPEALLTTTVKLRVRSFESQSSSSQSAETACQPVAHNGNSKILAPRNIEEMNPLSNGICPKIIPPTKTSTEMPSGGEVKNKSTPVKILFQKATPSNTLSMEMELPLPPPPAENTELPNPEYCMDVMSLASSPSYRISSLTGQETDNNVSVSPTSDKTMSPTEDTKGVTSVHTDIPSTLNEAPLSRIPSIKRAPLVSNLSLERKMSLRKACVDEYTLSNDATSELKTLSTPMNSVADVVPANSPRPIKAEPEETQESVLDPISKKLCCTSVSPTSLTSEERVSSASISSSEASMPSDLPLKDVKISKTPFLTQKEASSPKTVVKKAKLISSPSPERKFSNKKISFDLPNSSPKLSSVHTHSPDKTISPNFGKQKNATPNASPSTERKHGLYKPKLQKTPSPYSHSLDMASPPVRHKSNRKPLSRNLSTDNPSELTNKTQRTTPSQNRIHQTQPVKTTSEPGKTLASDTLMPLEADESNENKVVGADQHKSITYMQTIPQPLNDANQPNMKPVLEKICYSIKSIRQITQNKRPSCLERSNSLPDFSSHVASTFGSSSKALLAFLSVMTLKEGLTSLNMNELNANNVSCAEALKMIDSLREIACIEDSHKLKTSLSDLQQSASKQLLQSWKGFQELSDRCKSRSSLSDSSEQELNTKAGSDCGIEENVIDEIMDDLDVPEKLKEELASFSAAVISDNVEKRSAKITDRSERSPEENSGENTKHFSINDSVNVQEVIQDDKAAGDVRSIIKKFSDVTSKQNEAVTKCQRGTPSYKQIPEERQLYTTLLEQEDGESLQTCKDAIHQDWERRQSEDSSSIPEDECIHDDNAASQEERQKMSSANKDLGLKEKQFASSSEEGHQHSSEEEEPEVAWEESEKKRGDGEDLSMSQSLSEEEKDDGPRPNYYVELNVKGEKSVSNSEEEQSEVESKEPCDKDDSSCLSETQRQVTQACSMGLNVSVDESTGNSDADEQCSEEEPPEDERKELQAIVEENLSGDDGEQDDMEEEHLSDDEGQNCKGFSVLTEEAGGEKVSSEDEDIPAVQHVAEGFRYNAEEDSGNDHNSCEEHVDEEQPRVEHAHISLSVEEDDYEKETSSEEERCNNQRSPQIQESPALATQSTATTCEKSVVKPKHQSEEIISQTVAERILLLQKQVADIQKRKDTTKSPTITRLSQRDNSLESDVEDSPSDSPTSQMAPSTQSAPQSSLSFSYDSSGVITKEPEGRVRSIREMFLAKSGAHAQQSRFPGQSTPQLSELRAETSVSGGYQSQTSSELSSGEDDTARKSITKGFVRRAIERLYGKRDACPDEESGERPPLEPKQKKNEHSSIFSPFHAARTKAMSEFSYFSSSNALDTLSEATRCIAFNAQVGPGDSVPIDSGRWLLRENTVIRKSVSDPVGINKAFTDAPHGEEICKDTKENVPYSLFSTNSEVEDKAKTCSKKCTYFSLPHASESDVCQDDLSTGSKSSMNGDSIVEAKDNSEDTKTWVERNGMLPSIPDFKLTDNKVYPLPPDGEVVVLQPGKGQGVVNRRIQEPDVLDILYNFCGQHCPIL
ncbi:oxygen-regulated protein 1-like [Mugil cephalus]|uniref:oxygen-regulated protein 1-like n=1 Tax=Mugil cephalus TaxID=48193 RepID=UPI001FB64219|nr:oxygen-regulated protein 1-like [Mugil cephalus]